MATGSSEETMRGIPALDAGQDLRILRNPGVREAGIQVAA
jgi:hypothetical protein